MSWPRGIVYRLSCFVLAATQSCQLAGLCLRFVVVAVDDGGECVVSLFGIVSLLGSARLRYPIVSSFDF